MVTYLLGAGASANALPLVGEDFKRRFEIFITDLKRVRPVNQSSLKNYQLILDKTLNNIKSHASPDTFAKKSFLLGERHVKVYDQFKRILSCYIIWEQIQKNSILEQQNRITIGESELGLMYDKQLLLKINALIDDRYDVLCAALQNEPAKLPHNFSLISWNYDWQFEKTLNQYEFTDWPLSQTKVALIQSQKLLKLNGSAWLNNNDRSENIFNKWEVSESAYLDVFFEIILDDKNKFANELKFAWETFEKNEFNPRESAKDIFDKTTSLVVIGYSFPYYNRAIDKEFLRRMYKDNYPYPKKIYLQYYNEEEGIRMQEKVKLILQNATKLSSLDNYFKFITISDRGQFYIPDELLD